jgi:hypothetical protein
MKNNKKMRKTKLNVALNAIGGRFCTVTHKRRNVITTYCAKVIAHTEKYITVLDVNTDFVLKMSKDSLVAMKSGKTVFEA